MCPKDHQEKKFVPFTQGSVPKAPGLEPAGQIQGPGALRGGPPRVVAEAGPARAGQRSWPAVGVTPEGLALEETISLLLRALVSFPIKCRKYTYPRWFSLNDKEELTCGLGTPTGCLIVRHSCQSHRIGPFL